MSDKYYKLVGQSSKRIRLDEADRWKIARPFLTELALKLTDYIFSKDEQIKTGRINRKPFLEYDLEDFSNTNPENKSLAEIRRDSYTDGFKDGKADGAKEVMEALRSISPHMVDPVKAVLHWEE